MKQLYTILDRDKLVSFKFLYVFNNVSQIPRAESNLSINRNEKKLNLESNSTGVKYRAI